MHRSSRWFACGAVGLLAISLGSSARLDAAPLDPASKAAEPTATWRATTTARAMELALEWWQTTSTDPDLRTKVLALWATVPPDAPGAQVLEAACFTFALADDQPRLLMEFCSSPRRSVTLPDTTWLFEPSRPSIVRNNLRAWFGRWLVQERMYDEAQKILAGLEPGDVLDPATLLFHQGAVAHRLLDRENGLKSLDRLLDETADAPQRYVTVASAMRAELKALREGSLDHIAREMNDVERRLDLGHAGPKVRGVEDDIIARLDKIIDELEKKQKQQGGGGGGGSTQSNSPAQDSRILGGKGPGETEKRPLGSQSGWGDLPPKERQEALQQIGKDFPAHYREAIEEYFRTLAADDDPAAEDGP